MSSLAKDTALDTLGALEHRIQRLHFLLHGDSATPADQSQPHSQSQSVASRLQALQSSFDSVLTDSKNAQDLTRLQSQHAHPAPDLTQDALASLVLSHAPSYQATAARLTSLQDLPVPDPSSSAALVALDSRLRRILQRQQDQQDTIAQLRQQSVSLLGRWYDLGVVAMDDCWTEWEARLMHQERHLRRAEAEHKRQNEAT